MNILGISAHYHDAAACLVRGGQVLAAAQEERFTRRKHDPSLPVEAVRYCCREGGIDISDVDVVAYYEEPAKKLSRKLWMGLPALPPSHPRTLFRYDATTPEREIRDLLGYEGPVRFVEHHMSHAASAYFASGFGEAAVLVADGVGEWATMSLMSARGKSIECLEEITFPDSVGLLYSAMTAYLGFDVNDAEYKVMGLAPYGTPRFASQVRALIADSEGAAFRLHHKYFDFGVGERMYTQALCDLFGLPPRVPESELTQEASDLAASIQCVLEEVMMEKARYLHKRTGAAALCMAGGVALNCVSNANIQKHGPFEHVYVQPASSDAGGALGAALYIHETSEAGHAASSRLSSVRLGPAFTNEQIARVLGDSGIQYADFSANPRGSIDETSSRLARGEVVGWFSGRMEFGPRALGSRSILADPRVPEMRDKINRYVKMREKFRPFAPAVMREYASEHFEMEGDAPFMLFTYRVTSKLELPAITHVDNTARVQTVSAEDGGRFYSLIAEFNEKTGCPILLNTSFNLRGEPIVCTPEDAILTFVRSEIDVLVLEDFVIARDGIPERLLAWFRRTQPQPMAINNSVYTLL